MHDTIEKRISPEGIEILRKLIGKKLNSVYSPTLEVNGAYCRAPSFSLIPSFSEWEKDKWIIFTNTLHETRDGLDYFEFTVAVDSEPKDIGIINKNGKSLIKSPHSEIYLDGTSPVVKIELFEFDDCWQDRPDEENEFVVYDSGLIFTQENGFSFWLGANCSGL